MCMRRQECVLVIGPEDGLSVRLEDESKGLQSSVFMRPDVRDRSNAPFKLAVECTNAHLACKAQQPLSRKGTAVVVDFNPLCFCSQLFSSVDCPDGQQIFGVQFSLLLDTLQVCPTAAVLRNHEHHQTMMSSVPIVSSCFCLLLPLNIPLPRARPRRRHVWAGVCLGARAGAGDAVPGPQSGVGARVSLLTVKGSTSSINNSV